MINDYIQGLNIYRKSDEKHVREFILQQSIDQHDKFNRQRYLTTVNGGKAYQDWCNNWFLSGQRIRDLFDGIFEHVQNIKDLAMKEGDQVAEVVWTRTREEAIIRDLINVLCPGENRASRAQSAIAF